MRLGAGVDFESGDNIVGLFESSKVLSKEGVVVTGGFLIAAGIGLALSRRNI